MDLPPVIYKDKPPKKNTKNLDDQDILSPSYFTWTSPWDDSSLCRWYITNWSRGTNNWCGPAFLWSPQPLCKCLFIGENIIAVIWLISLPTREEWPIAHELSIISSSIRQCMKQKADGWLRRYKKIMDAVLDQNMSRSPVEESPGRLLVKRSRHQPTWKRGRFLPSSYWRKSISLLMPCFFRWTLGYPIHNRWKTT